MHLDDLGGEVDVIVVVLAMMVTVVHTVGMIQPLLETGDEGRSI